MNWFKQIPLAVFVLLTIGTTAPLVSVAGSDTFAKAAYREAKLLFAREKYNQAAAKFREAYEHKPSWKIMYNIGQCEAAAKNYGLALEAFEVFLSQGGDDVLPNRREQVLNEVDRLRRMVGYVKVVAPKGMVIIIDGTVRGEAPMYMGLPVSVGVRHILSGRHDQEAIEAQEFRVVGGQTIEIDLTKNGDSSPVVTSAPVLPGDETVDQPVEPTDEPGNYENFEDAENVTSASGQPAPKRSKLKVAGWITTGLGVGALATAGVLAGVAFKEHGDIAEFCKNKPSCPEKKDEVAANIKMFNVANGLFIGGGVVAGTGIALWIVGAVKEKRRNNTASFYPTISPDTLGIAAKWHF